MRIKFLFILFLIVAILPGCSGEQSEVEANNESSNAPNKEMAFEAINFEQFKTIFNQQDDVLYVVNFWATWCKPCVEELPHFMEVKNKYADHENFKMVLVSLDKSSDLQTKVKDFIAENQYVIDLYLLDDVKNMNTWIPAIDPSWSGAIPATIFYKNSKSVFFVEGQLSKEELENIITKNI